MSGGSNGFSTSEEHALMTGNLITCTVSMVCSGAIVISMLYLWCKSKFDAETNFTLLDLLHFRLVFLLSMSDVLYSFAMLMGDPDDKSNLCYFQAIFSSFFELCSLGWVLAIATTLWGQFVRKWPADVIDPKDKEFQNKQLVIYFVVINSISLLLTLLPLTADTYGDSGAWCWIDDSDAGQAMRYLTFYIWLWLGIIGIFVMYYQLMNELSDLIPHEGDKGGFCYETCRMIKLVASSAQSDDVHVAPVRRIMRRLCLYPIVLIVCWTFGTINRLQNSFDPDNPSIVLFWLHMWFSNLNGFGNAIVYGFNDSLRDGLKKYCCSEATSTKETTDKETNLDLPHDHLDEISVETDTPAGGGGQAEPPGVADSNSSAKGKNMNPI